MAINAVILPHWWLAFNISLTGRHWYARLRCWFAIDTLIDFQMVIDNNIGFSPLAITRQADRHSQPAIDGHTFSWSFSFAITPLFHATLPLSPSLSGRCCCQPILPIRCRRRHSYCHFHYAADIAIAIADWCWLFTHWATQILSLILLIITWCCHRYYGHYTLLMMIRYQLYWYAEGHYCHIATLIFLYLLILFAIASYAIILLLRWCFHYTLHNNIYSMLH